MQSDFEKLVKGFFVPIVDEDERNSEEQKFEEDSDNEETKEHEDKIGTMKKQNSQGFEEDD